MKKNIEYILCIISNDGTFSQVLGLLLSAILKTLNS